MNHEEFTTMPQVSTALNSILQTLEARDTLDAERRKVDDARDARTSDNTQKLLERVDAHGERTTKLETYWAAFFGENGGFTFVKKQLKEQGAQNKWILGLVVSTLIAIIVDLVKKH